MDSSWETDYCTPTCHGNVIDIYFGRKEIAFKLYFGIALLKLCVCITQSVFPILEHFMSHIKCPEFRYSAVGRYNIFKSCTMPELPWCYDDPCKYASQGLLTVLWHS